MRHFGSLLLAAVFAPSIFLLTGTGLSAFNSALDDNKLYDPLGSLAALGALLLAAVLYAILVMARLSPLGPGLAGLASLGISGWALVDITAYREFFSLLDVHMGGAVGETGLGILLGIPLVATLFSGRRWRSNDLYAPQAMPVRSVPSDTWLLPSTPVYQSTPLPEMPLPEMPLPDTPTPSLRYPASSAFQAPPPAGSSWRTPPYLPPLPESEGPTQALTPAKETETETSEPNAPMTFAQSLAAAQVSAPPVADAPDPDAPAPDAPAAEQADTKQPDTKQPVAEQPDTAEPLSDLPSMEFMAEKLLSWSSTSATDSEPSAPIVLASPEVAEPLPRRVPAPPPGGREVTEPIISPPPPPDNEVTERLGTPGSIVPQAKPNNGTKEDETVQLRPES